ncbi:MAG TPA: endo-1,4-beta-xylanase [Ilumatobacteraceae bacterium]|nr:endo-1,4-beta-xylanase [Ilumatobacteraceae bacterium]
MTHRLARPFRGATGRRLAVVRCAAIVVAVGSVMPSVGHAQAVSLRPLADDAGLVLGAAIDAETLGDDAQRSLLRDHVNLVSTRGDLSMSVVQPEPGGFDFGRADAIVDFAVENDLPVRGHELIGGAVPEWVATGNWTADSLGQVLRDHVEAVVGHFRERNPGVIVQWDVVGDAFLADGTPRPTIWQQVIGDDHLRVAFEAARTADPDAQLFYDDFYDDLAVTQDAVASGVAIVPGANAERTTCDAVPKCVGIRDRIAALVAAGGQIDGVGFQSHLFSPDPADFGQLSSWVGDLGLDWAVTEFDVPLPITETGNAEILQFQAGVYAEALSSCADAANCDTFVTWGITDRLSPIPVGTGGVFGGALWFDENDDPKPAFDAMAGVLRARGAAPTTTPTTTESTEATVTTTVAPGINSEGADGADDSNDTGVFVPVVVGAAALVAIAGVIVFTRRRR